jgi:hypothetical protein
LVVGIGTGTEALKDYSKKKGEEQKAELKKKEEEEGRKEEELVMKALANKNLDYSSLL